MPKKIYVCCGCRRFIGEKEAESNKLTHDITGNVYVLCEKCFESLHECESIEEESSEKESGSEEEYSESE